MYTSANFHIFNSKINPIDRYVNYHNVLYNVLSGLDPLNTRMSLVDFVYKCYISTLPNVAMSVLVCSRVSTFLEQVTSILLVFRLKPFHEFARQHPTAHAKEVPFSLIIVGATNPLTWELDENQST